MQEFKIFITCPKGIPVLLKQELSRMGYPVIAEQAASVETRGTLDDALRLNLFLRTGHRVLLLLREFYASDADELYRGVREIPWEQHIPADGYFCVTSSVENPTIHDARFASLRCKDAVVDRIRDESGRRPDSGSRRDRSVVHLYWKDNLCRMFLDTSGEPLSRRGYRKIPLAAPMQETLASAVVLATGWDGTGCFINPMCGSGTLAIEAALIGLDRAPGLLRGNFAFMHMKGFEKTVWESLREEARKRAKKELSGKILASDIDPAAVEAARKNAATAGVEHLIEFSVCNFSDIRLPSEGGVVVMNPEYGERMGQVADLSETYRAIGDFFKQKCQGFHGYVFTGNAALAKQVKLKAARSLQFYNSGIECRLLGYELYSGSRKVKKPKVPSP